MIKTERLQKVIAASGYTSRRKAEQLIIDKRVKVNGVIASELGVKVSDNDVIMVDDKPIKEEDKVYYLLNKPKNILSSVSDDRGRTVAVDLINDNRRIYPVGRLDYDTTGLLMLTNDGDFTNAMTHPSFEINKTYEVLVDKFITMTMIGKLEKGIILDGEKTLPARVIVNNFNKHNQTTKATITIREGKNRQVKRMFEAIGTKVLGLHRSKVAFLDLKGLKLGSYRILTTAEVNELTNIAKIGENNER